MLFAIHMKCVYPNKYMCYVYVHIYIHTHIIIVVITLVIGIIIYCYCVYIYTEAHILYDQYIVNSKLIMHVYGC